MASTGREVADEVGDSPLLRGGARGGYAASGLLHLVMAWITLQVAWGTTSQEADQAGALQNLAGHPLGLLLLWAVAAGFGLLALWQATETLARTGIGQRAKALGKLGLYASLAWTAVQVASRGSATGGDQLTASLMAAPFGRLAVGLVGLAVVGVGIYHLSKGARRKFLQDLRENPGPLLVRAAQVGYAAKGVALLILGALLVVAALTADESKATGLDGALRSLKELPLGQVLLTFMAAGLLAYGIYSFGRARYARV